MAQKGKQGVTAAVGDAMRDLARQRRMREDPAPALSRGEGEGVRAGKWTPNALGLPREDPCPVIPLGIEGDLYHLLDSAGQLRSFAHSDFSHAGIQALFASCPNYPEWAWPRYGRAAKEGVAPPIKSFVDDEVRKCLFRACTRKGLFSARNKVRGRGAWRRPGGQLVYHAGEELWTVEAGRLKTLDTGVHDGMVYPRRPPVPAPWSEAFDWQDNPAKQLIEGLRSWNWERPDVDPVLMLGWIGVALLGGALDWRSAVFLVGDKETGKSTLQSIIKQIFGDGLLDSADTTAAGIYQAMGQDSLPVAVDELEATSDNRKVMAVVELARAASSGAFGRRGGSDHHGVEYQMRSTFLFSAINNPPLRPQDLSRLAVLRLGPLEKDRAGQAPPKIDVETCGRMLLARLIREFGRFPQTLASYREILGGAGHGGRGQDTYGTLLACADLLLGPDLAAALDIPMVDELAQWGKWLAADALPEVEDAAANWRACLMHLLTARVEAWRNGIRTTVGQLLEDLDAGRDGLQVEEARRQLAQAGLGLIEPLRLTNGASGIPQVHEARQRGDKYWLAIPNQSQLVHSLFAGTAWQGAPGAGVWSSALRQETSREIIVTDKELNRVKINGVQTRCTLVVLSKFHSAPER